jgi:uncharacterized protein (DUF58 family)
MSSRSTPPPGPLDREAARVRFSPDLPGRIERCVARVSAELARREGPGGASLSGRGLEWIGFRPYRPGDDAALIDPSLLARLQRPFVRETRREASSRWLLALDQSASLAVGRPSKLQACAELAAALAALGLRAKARVTLLAQASGGQPARQLTLERRGDLLRGLRFLAAGHAAGADGPWSPPAACADVGRIFWLSDPFAAPPSQLDRWCAPGRELFVVQFLAPLESDPPSAGSLRWRSPESGAEQSVELTAERRGRYLTDLESLRQAWAREASVRRAQLLWCSSSEPFEDSLLRLFGGVAARPGRAEGGRR